MRKAVQVIAAIALVAGTTVVAWWAIGDQSTTGPRLESHPPPLLRIEGAAERPPWRRGDGHADHVLQPWDISIGTERAIAAAAGAVALAGAAVLVLTRRTFDRTWWGVIGLVALVGLGAALTIRILTAGVGGANIGAGLAIMFGTPIALVLLALAASIARHASR